MPSLIEEISETITETVQEASNVKISDINDRKNANKINNTILNDDRFPK
jgi:hypothetical protein